MKNSASVAPLLTKPYLRNEIDRELAGRRLREFVRQSWPIVEPSTPFVPGWHIDAIIEHLEAVSRGEIRSLLINVPPRRISIDGAIRRLWRFAHRKSRLLVGE